MYKNEGLPDHDLSRKRWQAGLPAEAQVKREAKAGEIATFLTLFTVGLMIAGILVGQRATRQAVRTDPQAAVYCGRTCIPPRLGVIDTGCRGGTTCDPQSRVCVGDACGGTDPLQKCKESADCQKTSDCGSPALICYTHPQTGSKKCRNRSCPALESCLCQGGNIQTPSTTPAVTNTPTPLPTAPVSQTTGAPLPTSFVRLPTAPVSQITGAALPTSLACTFKATAFVQDEQGRAITEPGFSVRNVALNQTVSLQAASVDVTLLPSQINARSAVELILDQTAAARWEISSTSPNRICTNFTSGAVSCPANPANNNNRAIIEGIELKCGAQIRYGWIMKRRIILGDPVRVSSPTPTPSPAPTSLPRPTFVRATLPPQTTPTGGIGARPNTSISAAFNMTNNSSQTIAGIKIKTCTASGSCSETTRSASVLPGEQTTARFVIPQAAEPGIISCSLVFNDGSEALCQAGKATMPGDDIRFTLTADSAKEISGTVKKFTEIIDRNGDGIVNALDYAAFIRSNEYNALDMSRLIESLGRNVK